MNPTANRRKGLGFQEKVKNLILKHFTELEADDLNCATGGQNGEDIRLSPAARKLFPFQIEAKKSKAMAVYTAYEQCKGHGKHEPVLFIEVDRKKPLVVVDAELFLALMAAKSSGEAHSHK